MPFPATQHTLANGLTLYFSPNPAEPRIYTQIAVRAGSKHDPEQSTGLAHYLEHMLFKGTDKIGSSDWAAEEPLLHEIAEAYEAHRRSTDPAKRRSLYRRIDQLSQRAAAYALPGEYDRIIAQLGARDTNAYTWVDQTVFLNDIPSNELARWMELEAERFSRLVLRLFHTELETVFEEFNITQDSDARKSMRVANEALFRAHPYGTHTTIGKGDHLKAPSHFDIYDFFARHYVPANMCVVLAGDFDADEALEQAHRTFGRWTPRPVPTYDAPVAQDIVAGEYTVYGEESDSVQLNWRVPGAGTREALAAELSSNMLFNQQAGLFDLDLLQTQRVLKASAGVTPMAEFGVLRTTLRPRPGQSLEDARALGLEQVARLALGNYPHWLREAVLVDHELSEARTSESNRGRAQRLTTAFLHRLDLYDVLHHTAALRTVSDQELQAFAKTYLASDKCVTVFKRQGPDPEVMKVEKPDITPVPLHTTQTSGFAERLLALPTSNIAAEFVDLNAAITRQRIDPLRELQHLRNTENELFELLYVYDFGTRDDRWAKTATDYLSYLGTAQRSASELEIELYRLGLQWQVSATANRLFVGVSGLDKHVGDGLRLLDELLTGVEPNAEAYANMVADIAQTRRNERADKQLVLRKGLSNYGRYGAASPILAEPTTGELAQTDPKVLVDWIHRLPRLPHQVFYYGPQPVDSILEVLRRVSARPKR